MIEAVAVVNRQMKQLSANKKLPLSCSLCATNRVVLCQFLRAQYLINWNPCCGVAAHEVFTGSISAKMLTDFNQFGAPVRW